MLANSSGPEGGKTPGKMTCAHVSPQADNGSSIISEIFTLFQSSVIFLGQLILPGEALN